MAEAQPGSGTDRRESGSRRGEGGSTRPLLERRSAAGQGVGGGGEGWGGLSAPPTPSCCVQLGGPQHKTGRGP